MCASTLEGLGTPTCKVGSIWNTENFVQMFFVTSLVTNNDDGDGDVAIKQDSA